MNPFTEWLHSRFTEALGWTLVHSLWEIAAIGGLAAIGFWTGRKWSAGTRYLLACAALLLMLAAPVGTYFYVLPPATRTAQPAPAATPLNLTSAESGRPLRIERPVWRIESTSQTAAPGSSALPPPSNPASPLRSRFMQPAWHFS